MIDKEKDIQNFLRCPTFITVQEKPLEIKKENNAPKTLSGMPLK